MTYIRFQKMTKIIGWIDLVTLIIYLVIAIIMAVILSPMTALAVTNNDSFFQTILDNLGVNANDTSRGVDSVKYALVYRWTSSIVDCVVCIAQCVASILLINSTTSGKQPETSLKMATVWICVNLPVMLVYFIWRIVDHFWVTLVTGPVIRGIFMYIVFSFVTELKRIVKGPVQRIDLNQNQNHHAQHHQDHKEKGEMRVVSPFQT